MTPEEQARHFRLWQAMKRGMHKNHTARELGKRLGYSKYQVAQFFRRRGLRCLPPVVERGPKGDGTPGPETLATDQFYKMAYARRRGHNW